MKKINLINRRFGKLVVIAKAKKTDKNHNQYWICKCDCGNYKEVRGFHLQDGNTKSCGCLSRLPKGESNFNQVYGYYKRNAKAANLPFKLTKIEFKKLTQQNCTYCGKTPLQIINRPRHNGKFIYNGIDRIDNSKGYIEGNCAPCCKICNLMKRTLSYKEFINKIKQIYQHCVTVVD